MLKAHPEWKSGIRKLEQSVNGKRYRYVPKGKIANTAVFRNAIHDGDIIAIITNKKGLDTTHIGIASWHKDGLHLLNASSIQLAGFFFIALACCSSPTIRRLSCC